MTHVDFDFILYIDVKNECQDDAKMKHIKYDIGLKKWVIKYIIISLSKMTL